MVVANNLMRQNYEFALLRLEVVSLRKGEGEAGDAKRERDKLRVWSMVCR